MANPGIKDLRGFLGNKGYYRRFLENYGGRSIPIKDLLKRRNLKWTERAQQAFDTLQRAMVSTPVLALPDFKKPFVLEADASDGGVGGA